MSAYVVSRTHIAAIVRAARDDRDLRWWTEDPIDGEWSTSDEYFAYIKRIHQSIDDDADVVRTCRLLTTAVVASVRHRYPDDSDDNLPGPAEPYWLTMTDADWIAAVRRAPVFSPLHMLHALCGYDYQACELPRYRRTEAYYFVQALTHQLIHRLPGYDAGPWEIDDEKAASGPINLLDIGRWQGTLSGKEGNRDPQRRADPR